MDKNEIVKNIKDENNEIDSIVLSKNTVTFVFKNEFDLYNIEFYVFDKSLYECVIDHKEIYNMNNIGDRIVFNIYEKIVELYNFCINKYNFNKEYDLLNFNVEERM